jgi:hypothetical protein
VLHQGGRDRFFEVRLSTLIGFEGIEDIERLRIETKRKANHAVVSGSATASACAPAKKDATSASLPGFA